MLSFFVIINTGDEEKIKDKSKKIKVEKPRTENHGEICSFVAFHVAGREQGTGNQNIETLELSTGLLWRIVTTWRKKGKYWLLMMIRIFY